MIRKQKTSFCSTSIAPCAAEDNLPPYSGGFFFCYNRCVRPVKKTYAYVLTLPDRLYPFSCNIGGHWVRGRRSYERAVALALRRYGVGRLGYRLTLYRETFHFTGSLLFIFLAAWLSKNFFGSEGALYVLLASAIVALSYQEFYLHPKRYGQHLRKGIAD